MALMGVIIIIVKHWCRGHGDGEWAGGIRYEWLWQVSFSRRWRLYDTILLHFATEAIVCHRSRLSASEADGSRGGNEYLRMVGVFVMAMEVPRSQELEFACCIAR
jgi:hypothetical protein